MDRLRRLVPILAWLPGYRRADLPGDLTAGLTTAVMLIPFRVRLYKKFKPGTGPDEKRRANTKFEAICVGTSTTSSARTVISGGDPGYNETAKMFSQSAFTLLDKKKDHTIVYGVLTPVEAFGMELVQRLRKEGIRIE